MRIVNMNNKECKEIYDARIENFKSHDELETVFAALTAEGFSVDEYEDGELTVSGNAGEYYGKKGFLSEIKAIVKK
jgi:hypothetical protein